MKTIKTVLTVCIILTIVSCTKYATTQSTVQTTGGSSSSGPKITTVNTTSKIGKKELQQLKEEWREDIISAEGEAPVVAKYGDPQRDKMLAKKGAVLDAQRKIAEKISEIKISSTTTMRDFQTSDVVRSKVDAYLKDIEVVKESYDEKNQIYKVTLEMPKITLINVLESTIVD